MGQRYEQVLKLQYFFKNILSFFFVGSIVEYWIQMELLVLPVLPVLVLREVPPAPRHAHAHTHAHMRAHTHAYIYELTTDDDDP